MSRQSIGRLLSFSIAIALLGGTVAVAGAFHDEPEDSNGNPVGFLNPGAASSAHAFFPWVPNGANDMADMGPFHGSITIQNLEHSNQVNDGVAEVDLFVGTGSLDDSWEYAGTINLAAKESQTLSAAALGIESPGASVVAAAYLDRGAGGENPEEPVYAHIAGVAKNVNPTSGQGAKTTAADTTVDGYSALNGDQIAESGNSAYILPIVQTNHGWDTVIRVANFDEGGGSAQNVIIDLVPADNQEYDGTLEQVQLSIPAGGIDSFTLSDAVGPDWVGTAYIQSGSQIGAVAERYKTETSMLITNTSRPESEGGTEHYAALVYKGYNFWNTGISIANLSTMDNNVSISYYGPTNNVVGVDTLSIPPRAMEFVHTPGWQEAGFGPDGGFVGSAIIRSTSGEPLMAAVDQIKYFGNDPEVGQAMSYVTNGLVTDEAGSGQSLAMPLIQKGSATQETGDSSGVQLFNTSTSDDAGVALQFFTANGNPAEPTMNADGSARPIEVNLGVLESYTLHTDAYERMSGNFQGSLVAYVENGYLVGVSNNVNYAVGADGSVAFPMIVYSELSDLRLPPEQGTGE